jgi:ElaB/YqjD/DUF883 family membrane-anchored ribosome-binding protein
LIEIKAAPAPRLQPFGKLGVVHKAVIKEGLMAAPIENDLATLQADMQKLRADFAKMTADMRDIASTRVSQAGTKAQESAEKVWDEVRRQAQTVGQEIEERPFTSALAAFGTGLLLGMLLNARRG